MALTVGELVAYVTLDTAGWDGGVRTVRRDLAQLATDITRATERAGTQGGQTLGDRLAEGAQDGAQDAVRAALAGLDPLVQGATNTGQEAGGVLGDSLTTAVRAAGNAASDAGGAGLSGLEAHARQAADAAGGVIDDGLVAGAREAAREATARAGDALESGLEAAGEQAGERGGEGLLAGLTAGDAAAAAAGLGLGLSFADGFGEALERDALTAKLKGQLGASAEDASRYGEIAGRLYVSTLADTFEDGTQAIRNVIQSGLVPADATNEQLESISQKVLALAKTFELDLGMATVAVGQMIRSGMVKDATEGIDLISRAFQINDARADDMLDTLKEYPAQFSSLGLDGKTALGIIQQALDATGKDTDLAADALKELRIRVVDLSAAEGLEQIGLDAQQMADDFAAGGPRASAALDLVMDRLNTFPNAGERFRITQKIMGTQSEDLVKAFMAIDPSEAAKKIAGFSGTSQQQIEDLTQNSSAQLEQFKRQLQSEVVDVIGGEVIPALMDMARFVKDIWEGMPEEGQTAIQILTMAGLALVGVTLAFGLAQRGAQAFTAWLAAVQTQAAGTSLAMRTLQASMGFVGLALAATTTVMALFSSGAKSAKTDSSQFAKSLEQDAGTIGEYTRKQALAALETAGLGDVAAKAGIQMGDMVDALLGAPGAMDKVTSQFKAYSATFDNSTLVQKGFEDALNDAHSALEAGREEYGRSQQAQEQHEQQTGDTTTAIKDQQKAVEDLSKAFDELTGQFLDGRAAQRDYESAIDDLTASIEENGRSLDLGTEKGRANDEALEKMVKSSYDLSKAVMEQTGSQEEANAVLVSARNRLYDVLIQMGYTKDAAKQLTEEYFRIPAGVSTDVTANTGMARRQVADLKSDLNGIPRTINVSINAGVRKAFDSAFGMINFADGGVIPPRSFRAYADGAHVAQIARAGDYRLFAEPETGGEAYIPLAESKRPRSTEILADVAARFGYQLMPAGGRRFDDGGTVGGQAGGAGGQQTIRLELSLDRDGLIQVVRKGVADRGGNVQVVLGR
jgi:tetratricopeptide (TPR) repeat protein